MLELEEYVRLIEDLNGKICNEANDFRSPFVLETDGFECAISYNSFIIFCSQDFAWIDDDEPNFIPYRDQVINEIKNQFLMISKEIRSILEWDGKEIAI